MKICKTCGIGKPLNQFGLRTGAKDGRLSSCKKCEIEKYRANTAEQERRRQYREKNKEKIRERSAKWQRENKDKCRARTARYRKRNPYATKETYQKAMQNNHGAMLAKFARRRAAKKNATVSWSNKFIIDEIYELSSLRTKATGVKHEVDHICPIQSNIVCGLHVENNLRIVTANENRSKGNRFEVAA